MSSELRMTAEWEAVEAVLVAWPHAGTDWAYMLEQVRETYIEIITALSQRVKVIVVGPTCPDLRLFPRAVKENIIYVDVPTNDTWTRDYGPISIEVDGARAVVDFQFNGWGLKFASDKDNMVTGHLCRKGIISLPRFNKLSFTLEGGSIESDGKGLILTTADCLMSANRNGGMSQAQIEAELKDDLGATEMLWLHHGALTGDDTDGHIDTLVRILPPGDTLVYVECTDPDDEHYESLQAMAEELRALRRADGEPFNLCALPLPDAVYDPDDGSRLPATYANFLIVNDMVLMPVYNQPLKDRQALLTMQAVMPGYIIIPIDCRSLVRQHGSLHCATMQIAALSNRF